MIGKRIRGLREKNGLSITELAKQADISKSYLSHIERSLQKNPSLQFLNKIANSLDTSIDNLLGVNSENSTELELDDEWKDLVLIAIKDGIRKEDFQEFQNYIRYENWKNQDKIDKNSPHS
jgi:XRE family transcriptional regulator, master regulator for biofilm formation